MKWRRRMLRRQRKAQEIKERVTKLYEAMQRAACEQDGCKLIHGCFGKKESA